MSDEFTPTMWAALAKLAQHYEWFDERYKDWTETMKPYYALCKAGCAVVAITGPGDSITEFKITEQGRAKLAEKPAE